MADQPAEWAIVELMGHRQRAGRVAEVEKFGTKMLRVDIPHEGGEVTEFYGHSSIYAMLPCTEEVARAAADRLGDPRPVTPVSYRLPAPTPHDYDDDEERPF